MAPASSALVTLSQPPQKKPRKSKNQAMIKKLVHEELLKSLETKQQWDSIGGTGNGITDNSRALTCFRIQRGNRINERNGTEVTPLGIRIDYHLANTDLNQMRAKIAVLELNGNRTLNAGNAGTYILDHLLADENSPDGTAVDSTALLQAERMTTPLNTRLFDVLSVRQFDMGKPNGLGVRDSYASGSMYVKIRDRTPIHYTSTASTRPGDPDVSRNIVVVVWAGSPDVRNNVGFAPYQCRLNIRQYFKDN